MKNDSSYVHVTKGEWRGEVKAEGGSLRHTLPTFDGGRGSLRGSLRTENGASWGERGKGRERRKKEISANSRWGRDLVCLVLMGGTRLKHLGGSIMDQGGLNKERVRGPRRLVGPGSL